MKRFILTDVGNILTTFKFRAQLLKEIMAAYTANPINVQEMFSAAENVGAEAEAYYHGLDTGTFNVQNLWERLVDHCKVSPTFCTYPLFLSLWCKHLVPIMGVVDLYRDLQQTYSLIAVSNGDSEGVRHILYHLMGTHGLRFDEIFISAERRRKKPDLPAGCGRFSHGSKCAAQRLRLR